MKPFETYRSQRLEKGLSLEERPRATTYAAVARINGKVYRWNTETSDYERACRQARSTFQRYKTDHIPGSTEQVTMHDAAKAFIRSIKADTPTKKEAKQKYHQSKWNAISDFFRAMDVEAVTTPVILKFIESENRSHAKPVTQRKDLVTIRQILKYCVYRGWLKSLPVFPPVGKIVPNPRPWLEPAEWERLQKEAVARIKDASDEAGSHRYKRMDLLDFIRLQVATCMRVDELRSVRKRDVKVVTDTSRIDFFYSNPEPGKRRVAPRVEAREYLEITLQKGKTGPRTVLTRVSNNGVETFTGLVKRKNLKDGDLLFDAHHRDGFRELLIATDLRQDASGNKRNLKSLRSTGMMLWILEMPNANLKMLATAWGTSVTMIDQFYLRRLGVQFNRQAIVG